MPHVVVEYSSNIEDAVNIPALLYELHEVAIASGLFETGSIRTRAIRHDIYAVADRDPANAFIHINGHIRPRPVEVRRRLGQALFDAAAAFVAEARKQYPMALSVEMTEIDDSASFHANDLPALVKARGGEPGG